MSTTDDPTIEEALARIVDAPLSSGIRVDLARRLLATGDVRMTLRALAVNVAIVTWARRVFGIRAARRATATDQP